MEDIEDIMAGKDNPGSPSGFRLSSGSVGINPNPRKIVTRLSNDVRCSSIIPGCQIIYMKTFGCSHNQSDSEYMAGQLSTFGYTLSDNPEEADLWLINTVDGISVPVLKEKRKLISESTDDQEGWLVLRIGSGRDTLKEIWSFSGRSVLCRMAHRADGGSFQCTVKSPSQSAMETLIKKCKSSKKPLVVAGCVPQGSQHLKELEGISIVGVQQIDRVVEVVEETLKGHEVRLLSRRMLPTLDLPKVRKNKFVEIIPINVGCLGACTYCKTKHARGHLGSYSVENLVSRVKSVISDGVMEIWLSSEDTGAYGRDIGVNLPILLKAIVDQLPSDGSTMLRIGMTNPPFILEHLKEIAEVLLHPCVYAFLHIPVQSGSDTVLHAMNREYTIKDFRTVVNTLTLLVPGIQIATDIICGFPGETDEDFSQTVHLVQEYKFSQVHISQFYPRPGTPAARMKKLPGSVVKNRTRHLTSVFEMFIPYVGMEGRIERIWITEIAADGTHLVLVEGPDTLLGTSAVVKITSVGRWSVFGEIHHQSSGRGEGNQATVKIWKNQRINGFDFLCVLAILALFLAVACHFVFDFTELFYNL